MPARILAVLVLSLAAMSPLAAQNTTAFSKTYEDFVLKIWYMHWRQAATPVEPYRHDGAVVNVFLEDGTLRMPSGATQPHKAGDVVYFDRGSVANAGDLVTNAPMRALTVELKAVSVASLPPTSLPAAFPRSNANLVLENAAVRVWDVWYRPDQPLPTQVYVKNTVQVWLTAAIIERAHQNEPLRQDVRARGAFEVTHAGYVVSERVLGAPAQVIAIERK